MRKNIILAIFVATIMIVSSILANATPTTEYVKINGDQANANDQLIVERGDTLDIRVRVNALNGSESNVNIEAYIDGYEYSDREPVSDSAEIFDMDAGDTKTVDLSIKIPLKAEKDYYDLKVRVGTRRGLSEETVYRINLKGTRHEMLIKDILMPSQVQAGRGLFANVKIENIGQKDEQDITIKFKISDLKIEEFTTIDELEADDSTTSEDIVALIPECAKPGKYDVTVSIEFNEYDIVSKTEQIEVIGSDVCEAQTTGAQAGEKTVISVPGAQDVAQGSAVAFPIMIQNMGAKSKTYVITVSKAVDAFGQANIQPSNVIIVGPQKTETVFVYVKTNENAQIGQKDFTATITSGEEKKDVMLSANVVKASASSGDLKNALEIGLVILVIILVIAGLIIGFNKLKPKEEEKSEIGQTYY